MAVLAVLSGVAPEKSSRGTLKLLKWPSLRFISLKKNEDRVPKILEFREVTFLIGGGSGPGLRRGRSLVKFLQTGEDQTCFVFKAGEGHTFFSKEKNYSMSLLLKRVFYFIYLVSSLLGPTR